MSLFEEVYGASKPSLYGSNRATFTVRVDREMATLMERALRGGIAPIGVIYDLKFDAMMPAFSVKVEARYDRVYNHLEAEFGIRGTIKKVGFAAEIAAAFQHLRENGAIKVEITDFTDDEDMRKQADAAWEWFREQLIEDFFDTKMTPPGFMTREETTGGMLGQLTNMLGGLGEAQRNAMPRPLRGAPSQATPTTGPENTEPSEGTPATDQTNRQAANANGGGQAAGSGSVAPTDKAGPALIQVGLSLKFYRQDELRTRTFDFTRAMAVERTLAPQGLFTTMVDGMNLVEQIQEIDMDDPFFDRILATVTMGADLEAAGIASVAVNMEYPANRPDGVDADHVDGFLFRPGASDPGVFSCFVNDAKEREYRYKMTITFDPTTDWRGRDSQVETDWIVTTDRQLSLSPMDAVELMDTEIAPGSLPADVISQVQIDLAYDDQATGFSDTHRVVVGPQDAPSNWRLRLADDARREYRRRDTFLFREGSLRYSPPEYADSGAVIVNAPFRGQHRMRLVPMLDPATLFEAIVDITYQEPDTGYRRTFQRIYDGFSGRPRSESITFPTIQAEPADVTYFVTVVRQDMSTYSSDEMTSENGVILITDGAGTLQRIRVELPHSGVGDFMGLRVSVMSDGADPDEAQAFFSPSATEPQFVTLVQPDDGGRTYRYEVTGYDMFGQPSRIAEGSADDTRFIVPMG